MDVVAELRAQIEELEAEPVDLARLELARELRALADGKTYVILNMQPAFARTLAADLEELSALRIVPPTGDDG